MIKQALQFIQNHGILCTMFVVVTALLLFEELKNKLWGIPKISVQDTILSLNRDNAVVLDLRSVAAFSNGHILNSINIVRTTIDDNLNKLEAYKERPLILVDDNDSDANFICSKLQKSGFTKVYILSGGLPAWKDAKLPLSNKN